MTDLGYSLLIVLGIVIGLLAMLVIGLLRSHAEILRKLDSLGAGLDDSHAGSSHGLTMQATRRREDSQLPTIVGVDPDGEPVAIAPTSGSNPTLIAFLSTSCSSCTLFWEEFDRPEMVIGEKVLRVVISTLGPNEESPTRAQALKRGSANVVMSSESWEQYEVPGAPYFVVVDPSDGLIGEGSAENFQALSTFLQDSSNDRNWDKRAGQSGADRADRIDQELRDAGIQPGDPRLHHRPGEIDGD